MLTLEALQSVGTKSNRKSKNGARVTSKVVSQVEAGKYGQASIGVAGVPLEKAGNVTIEVDNKKFMFEKKEKQNTIWGSKVENQEDFIKIFGILAANPDKYQGKVSFVELKA